jgi:hypothetical protein
VYRIVHPYGRDRTRQAMLISEHPTVEDAFAEIDRVAERMADRGVPTGAVELIVVDATGQLVTRPGVH